MTNTEELPQEVVNLSERRRNVPDLKLVVGGGDDGSTSGNWLLDMPVGTQFIVADKLERQNFLALQLEVLRKTPQTVTLWAYPNEIEDMAGKPFGKVIPSRFVNRFDLLEQFSPSDENQQFAPDVPETPEQE